MSDLTTMTGRGQRASGFRYELLAQDNSFLGDLPVMDSSTPSITNNINRTVKRAMDGLRLPPSVTADIDTLSNRVRPWMVMEDRTEHPLGVFLFSDASRRLAYYGSVQYAEVGLGATTEGAMFDQLATLNQSARGINFYNAGHSVHAALQQQMAAGGVIEYDLDDTEAVTAEPIVWKPDEKRLTIINDLCRMAGFYSLWFDNTGRGQLRGVPTLESVEPTLTYGPDEGAVYLDTVVETDDLLDAPNVYQVVNSSFTERPIWGEWVLPASAPHSVTNRGFAVVKTYDVQGIESNGAAAARAKSLGQADYSTYRWVECDTAINPTHDTFDIIGWMGDKYREQSWSLTCRDGAGMHHEWRRVWSEDAVVDLLALGEAA